MQARAPSNNFRRRARRTPTFLPPTTQEQHTIMPPARWTNGSKANKMVLQLIQEGAINEENVSDQRYMVSLYASKSEFRRFSMERFIQGAREGLEKKDEGASQLGKCIICHVATCIWYSPFCFAFQPSRDSKGPSRPVVTSCRQPRRLPLPLGYRLALRRPRRTPF